MRYVVAPLPDWAGLDPGDRVRLARHHRTRVDVDAPGGGDLVLLPHGRPGWLRVPGWFEQVLPLLDEVAVGALVAWPEFPRLADTVRALYDAGLLFVGGRTGVRAVPAPRDPAGTPPPASLLLKLTGACDMACSYCYDYDEQRWPARMSTELARRLIDECLRPGHPLTLMFHGGEPMLRFGQIRELVDFAIGRAGEVGASVGFTVQTNGLHFTDETVAFLRHHRFAVGVSLDGPRELHDRYRVDHAGRSTFDRILRNFIRFNDFMRHEVGYISVVANDTSRDELEAAWVFFRDLGVRSWKLLPAEAEGRARGQLETPALQRVFIDFLAARLGDVVDGRAAAPPFITNLVQLIEPLVSVHRANMCMRMPCGASDELLVLDATGGVRACDSSSDPVFQLVGARPSLPLRPAGLVETARATDAARALRERERWLLNEAPCASCPWLHQCAGTCPARALIAHGTLLAVDELECATRLALFPRILADVSRPDSRLRDYHERAVRSGSGLAASGLPG